MNSHNTNKFPPWSIKVISMGITSSTGISFPSAGERRERPGCQLPGPKLNSSLPSHSAKMSIPRDHSGESSLVAKKSVTNQSVLVASMMGVMEKCEYLTPTSSFGISPLGTTFL
jgi:hypothetical protein